MPSRSPRTSRSSCTFAPAPPTPRTMWPRSGPTVTRGSSTTAGTPTGSGCSPARRNWASCRPTPSCRATPRCAGLGQPVAGRPPAGRPDDGGVRRVPVPTIHIERLLDFLKETGQFDNTLIMLVSDNGASPEVGSPGPPTRGSSSTTRPSRWRTASTRSTSLAARPPSTTTRGGGPGPGTPRFGGGSGRPIGAVPAIRSWSTGRQASTPMARSATSTPTSSTWSRPCWTPWGSSRRPRSGA